MLIIQIAIIEGDIYCVPSGMMCSWLTEGEDIISCLLVQCQWG